MVEKCAGKTLKGSRCSRLPRIGEDYCHQHIPKFSERERFLAKKRSDKSEVSKIVDSPSDSRPNPSYGILLVIEFIVKFLTRQDIISLRTSNSKVNKMIRSDRLVLTFQTKIFEECSLDFRIKAPYGYDLVGEDKDTSTPIFVSNTNEIYSGKLEMNTV